MNNQEQLVTLIGEKAARLSALWQSTLALGTVLVFVAVPIWGWSLAAGSPVLLRVAGGAGALVGLGCIALGVALARLCSRRASDFVGRRLGYTVKLPWGYQSVTAWRRAIRREQYFHDHGRPKMSRIVQNWSEINRLCDAEDTLRAGKPGQLS